MTCGTPASGIFTVGFCSCAFASNEKVAAPTASRPAAVSVRAFFLVILPPVGKLSYFYRSYFASLPGAASFRYAPRFPLFQGPHQGERDRRRGEDCHGGPEREHHIADGHHVA